MQKKAKLLSHLVDVFKEDAINTFSCLLIEITHAKLPGALPQQVQTNIVKSAL